MAHITIYQKKTGKKVFDIKCSIIENTLPSMMPSRTFNKPTLSWRADIVRLNIEYLKRNNNKFTASPEVYELLTNFSSGLLEVGEFPSDYPFKLSPKPHQLKGLQRTFKIPNPGIFCDIGTGKTKLAIDTACCRYLHTDISIALVVCPMSIRHNWVDEIKKNSPVPTNTHMLDTSKGGQKKFNIFLNEEDGFRWVIVAIESFSAGEAYNLCDRFVNDETMVIIDESDCIKNHKAIRTDRCIALSEKVTFKMILTGTPITQGIIDLYSQFEFLGPDIIGAGDFYSFRNRYTVMGGYDGKQVIGYQRVEELLEAVNPFIYQVRKRDVLTDLPPSTYETRYCSMSNEQSGLYKELKNKLMVVYNDKRLTVRNAINLMQRFTEITGGFISYIDVEEMMKIPETELAKVKYKKQYLKTNPKAEELMRFLYTLPNDEPVIIWAVNAMEVAYLVNLVGEIYGPNSLVEMHGGINEHDRNINLSKFVSGKSRFLIGNQSVGGVGLNMVNCCIMCYFSNNFSLRVRIQSEGRIERMGQQRPMLYIDFACSNSIDVYITSALKSKNDFAETIRGAFDSGQLLEVI